MKSKKKRRIIDGFMILFLKRKKQRKNQTNPILKVIRLVF